jgi:hypothetical protein
MHRQAIVLKGLAKAQVPLIEFDDLAREIDTGEIVQAALQFWLSDENGLDDKSVVNLGIAVACSLLASCRGGAGLPIGRDAIDFELKLVVKLKYCPASRRKNQMLESVVMAL